MRAASCVQAGSRGSLLPGTGLLLVRRGFGLGRQRMLRAQLRSLRQLLWRRLLRPVLRSLLPAEGLPAQKHVEATVPRLRKQLREQLWMRCRAELRMRTQLWL